MSSNSCSPLGVLSKWKRWPSSSGYHELRHSPSLPKKRRSDRSCSFIAFDSKESLLMPRLSAKKSKNPVPVVVASKEESEHKVFLVEPHILDHWLFQDLLQKSGRVQTQWGLEDWDGMEGDCRIGACGRTRDDWVRQICLDCDTILFEFFIWLVQNDDPSLRDLNLNDLMEFYGAES